MAHSLFSNLYSHKKSEIDAAFKIARLHSRGDGFKLLAYPKTTDYSKLLIIIPRAVGKASVRNRLRRQLKALFFEQEFYSNNSNSFILLCYHSLLVRNFEELKHLLTATQPTQSSGGQAKRA